ncbi:hypothetical protein [Cellvibrio sp. ARAG 10.3]
MKILRHLDDISDLFLLSITQTNNDTRKNFLCGENGFIKNGEGERANKIV